MYSKQQKTQFLFVSANPEQIVHPIVLSRQHIHFQYSSCRASTSLKG